MEIESKNPKWNGNEIQNGVVIENPRNIEIGKSCKIEAFCNIKGGSKKPYKLVIGNRVHIRMWSFISADKSIITIEDDAFLAHSTWVAGRGDIVIGKNSMVGPHSVIVSSNHDYMAIKVPYYYATKEVAKDISIGSNVWIGSNCVILPGVVIGDGSLIGAGTILTKSVPKNSLVTGIPGKIIRKIVR